MLLSFVPFVLFRLFSFRFVLSFFVSFCSVPFRFVSFRSVYFRFVSLCLVPFRLFSFHFVSLRFGFLVSFRFVSLFIVYLQKETDCLKLVLCLLLSERSPQEKVLFLTQCCEIRK